MSNKVITHEVKLEKSVKVILGVFAVGIFLNAFSGIFEAQSVQAQLKSGSSINVIHSGRLDFIFCDGCN